MLFPHPSANMSASGFMLFTRCLPRSSNGLASTTATLGSSYWLGFETSALSTDKKRLAWLGAQQILFVSPFAAISGERAMRKKREKKPLEYQGFFLGCVCISGGVRGTSGRWVTALIYGGAVCGGVLEGCESWWGFRRSRHTFQGIYRNTREPGSRVHARGGDGMDATPSALGYAA